MNDHGSAPTSGDLQVLSEDGERVLCRGSRAGSGARQTTFLAIVFTAESDYGVQRLANYLRLRTELDSAWAVRPLELVREHGRTMLVLEDFGGDPLDRALGAPLELGEFLRLAIGVTVALGKMHQRGLVHKDIKPANILASGTDGQIRLTGFELASRLPRERQAPERPETIAGTLAYMAPEQTGRMNRSIDSRSDLYALGVTLYQMLTGALPFTATEPMEWVHSHIAKRAVPPREQVADVPAVISRMVMKLLAKAAEDRYQSAAGLESDLRRCLAAWEKTHRIDDFPLAERDTPDCLFIPERLYGRSHEVETLLTSFDRMISSATPEMVLVSGYSGTGKSAVVNELHKVLVPSRGLFASGKFDQYKRDIPYSTLVQAFQGLVQSLLGKSEAELQDWRDALHDALGSNALLIVSLVPELKLIIGDQPPVPELPPQEAQRRFHLVFRRFVGVFAQPEHPLALFLDDLQWLDAATLDLLEDLLAQPDLGHLMLIGAYRNNEVDAAHPLTHKLEAIRKSGAKVGEIALAPLAREHVGQLIADALRCNPENCADLAGLVHEKTGGNPFFVIQFLYALADEGMLFFGHDAAAWSWDPDRIRAKGYTDNVVDLMVGKLSRLPAKTQTVLQELACLGNVVHTTTLSSVMNLSEEDLHTALCELVRLELVQRLTGHYKFTHDRVREAAYSLIPETSRAEGHLRVGRILLAQKTPESREEAIFEIVNQLNRGAHLISSAPEQEQLAQLNLTAGRRARISTAYASALNYLGAARALLTDECWTSNYALIFSIEYLTAECELLTSNMASAEARLSMLAHRTKDAHDNAVVTRLRLTLYIALGRSDRAIDVCLKYLRGRGTNWPPHPSRELVRREWDRIWLLLGSRSIEELVDLPLVTSQDVLDILNVLTEIVNVALHTDEDLSSLVICRMVNLSLEHGNSDASCFAYVWFAIIAGPRFGDYRAGFQFGRLGYDLVQQRGLTRYEARTYMSFGNLVIPWAKHAKSGRDLIVRAFDVANRVGDLTFAAYCCDSLNSNSLTIGDPLQDVQSQAEKGLAFAKAIRFGFVIDLISVQLALVRSLRGLTSRFGSFDDDGFDELQFEQHLTTAPIFALPECWYFARKAQARFLAGDYRSAVHAAARGQRVAWTSPSQFERVELYYYGALAHAACWNDAPGNQKQQHLSALISCYEMFKPWAKHCPENFETRAALLAGEIARIEGRILDAEHLYEDAIRSAHANDFVHNEAIANEVASRFYAARGFEEIARLYLRNARHGYLTWGAHGKVRQLDEHSPHLSELEQLAQTSVIVASVEHLDLATVIKVSEAVSGTMERETLLNTLVRIAITQAGAERGLLIVSQGTEQRISAEANVEGDTITVELRDAPASPEFLPLSVLMYVLRTREPVILDDAEVQEPFATDPYIRQRRARSVLCLPVMSHSKVYGALYLESSLAPRVFVPSRITILKLLASQAANALENTQLYRDLAEREAKIRRLVDSNIVGVILWNVEGRIFAANDAFLKMVGYDRDDLAAGRVHRKLITPPEWQDRDEQAIAELETSRQVGPFEKEYLRKDGSRIPVLIGGAMFDETGNEGVGFVVDLSERKRAEAEARDSERRYREGQAVLAHASRLATMGQLTASIAHEVNQPISAAVTNAHAALRFLHAEPSDHEEVEAALGRIVRDGTRAGEVIRRIRTLVRKTPARKDRIAINDATIEVVELTDREAAKCGVTVKADLADGLPLIEGDRVQLQQVILNLIVNAIDAMAVEPNGPRKLQVETGKTDTGEVFVAVRDTGSGLTAAALEHMFDAFYTTKRDGLGLGLSICQSIVEAHGGQLSASANVPHGAILRFTLPAQSVHL